jgi:hypothetical protein
MKKREEVTVAELDAWATKQTERFAHNQRLLTDPRVIDQLIRYAPIGWKVTHGNPSGPQERYDWPAIMARWRHLRRSFPERAASTISQCVRATLMKEGHEQEVPALRVITRHAKQTVGETFPRVSASRKKSNT